MVTRITLTHNYDQIELRLLYFDLNFFSRKVDGGVTDLFCVEIGSSLFLNDLDCSTRCNAYARIGRKNAFGTVNEGIAFSNAFKQSAKPTL